MEKGTSEIAKLTERISKDPKSKLFVPLAEEYKKTGDIEMAIAVLTEGLKNNPGYVTAKSFLGRLLLDKGNLSDAQKEFEEVIKAIPDNVLAQRKLGEIHALQGRAQEALLFFKAVLAANPKDPELNALVADIEAGRDVREKIAGPKYPPAAQAAAAAAPAVPPRPAAPVTPIKPPAAPAVPTRPQAAPVAPVAIPPFVDAEEPEEVLVFESLDEPAPAAPVQPQAIHDMFSDLAVETGQVEAARMDEGLSGGEGHQVAERSAEPQPVSVSDVGMMSEADHFSAADTKPGSGSPDAGSGNSFFDSEPVAAPIDIPGADSVFFDAAAAPDLSVPVTEQGPGSPDAGLDNMFFDTEPLPVQTTAIETPEPANVSAPDLFAGTEYVPDSAGAGLPDQGFFGSEPIQTGPQETAALDTAQEPAPEFAPLAEKTAFADISSESQFFGGEPIEAEAASLPAAGLEAAGELSPAVLEMPVSGEDLSVSGEASSENLLFDVEPAEEVSAPFGEAVPEADDFTTDTLAELYIAQGFYEKAIEIYERMLADRPNSKLLKDKLANVRAMGSASGTDEEQGTPVLFEAPGSPPIPSQQPLAADVARQWSAPGAEAKEYIPPAADDFESAAFDSGFAPVEYVLPETPGTVPQPSAGQDLQVHDEEPQPALPKTAASGKEQTIAKLDTWLKNILKEK